MATGDDAAAAGMDLVSSSSGKVKDGAEEINKTRDYVAQRTNAVTPVTKGGTGATTESSARVNLGIPTMTASADANTLVRRNENGRFNAATPTLAANVATKGYVDSGLAQKAENDTVGEILAGFLENDTWNRDVSSVTRRAVWMRQQSGGIAFGHTASSERYKKNIRPWDGLTDEQFAALSVVTFQWRNNVEKSDHIELGMIAERLAELGMDWAFFTDDDGRPEGIHYDRIVLAVIPYVQRLAGRVAALEASA